MEHLLTSLERLIYQRGKLRRFHLSGLLISKILFCLCLTSFLNVLIYFFVFLNSSKLSKKNLKINWTVIIQGIKPIFWLCELNAESTVCIGGINWNSKKRNQGQMMTYFWREKKRKTRFWGPLLEKKSNFKKEKFHERILEKDFPLKTNIDWRWFLRSEIEKFFFLDDNRKVKLFQKSL